MPTVTVQQLSKMPGYIGPGKVSSTSSGNSPQKIESKATDIARGLGLGDLPDISGIGYSLGQKAGVPELLSKLGINTGGVTSTSQNPFISPQIQKDLSTPQGAIGEAGRDAAGRMSWGLPTLSPFGAGGLATTLGNWGATGAARGALQGISQQDSPTGVAQSAATMAVLEPIARAVTGGLLRTGGQQIGSAISGASNVEDPAIIPNSDPNAEPQTIFDKIKTDAISGVNPANRAAASARANTIAEGLMSDMSNADNPVDAMQQVKTSMTYDPNSESWAKIVDTNVRKILGEQIASVAPDVVPGNQLYAAGSKVKGIENTLTQRLPYLFERAAITYPAFYLIRKLLSGK